MTAFKIIKTRYQTRYNANWLGPVLKKLEWAQQPNVEKKMGGLYHKNVTFSESQNTIAFKSNFYTISEAIFPGPMTLKVTEPLL